MLTNYLLIALSAFSLGILVIFLLKFFSKKYNLLISNDIPLIGGIGVAIVLVFISVFSLSISGNLTNEATGIIIASLVILIFGIIDDSKELSIVFKFFVQIIATTLLILSGVKTKIAFIPSSVNIIITFLWVIGITNAFNLLDVMDGLASGTAIIVSLAFFIISFLSGNIQIGILSIALTGAVLAFLIYNFPPARIYMGNAGSHFLGFLLAGAALAINYAPLEKKLALTSPILILGFVIFDMFFLILMRIKQRRSIFKKSADHLALRFLKKGYSKNKALLFMLTLCLFFAVSGIATSLASNFWSMIIVLSAIFCSSLVAIIMNGVKIEA
ncbi:MAG: MraY family glycosyltransferase [Candidatus Omnitrophota bacterium]